MKEKAPILKVLVKLLSLFTLVRAHQLVLMSVAIYFSALFIFSQSENHYTVILNYELFLLTTSLLLSIAAGYIINQFYDKEKDAVNQPLRSYINRFISQGFKLNTYLFINGLALLISFLVSLKMFAFIFTYQLLIWIYCHKTHRWVIFNNIHYVLMVLYPFLGLLLYYNNYSLVIFIFGAFLFILLWMIAISKDATSTIGDILYKTETIPIKYGIQKTKWTLVALLVLLNFMSLYLISFQEIARMKYYFYFQLITFIPLIIIILSIKNKTHFKILQYFLNILLMIGVISIVFIEINPLNLQKYLGP